MDVCEYTYFLLDNRTSICFNTWIYDIVFLSGSNFENVVVCIFMHPSNNNNNNISGEISQVEFREDKMYVGLTTTL